MSAIKLNKAMQMCSFFCNVICFIPNMMMFNQNHPSILNSITSFIFLLFAFTSLAFSQPATELETQALLKLKHEWPNSLSIKSWNPSIPPCHWLGIRCTNDSITGISLQEQNISSDHIPTSICELTNLITLNLSLNSFHGGFPIVLYNCSKLQVLDISLNNFEGPLPRDIHKLSSNLRYLNISSNNFSADIPSAIGRFTKLTTLSLFSNAFDGTFPSEIGNLVNLETLTMSYNPFVPTKIPHEFGQLKKLKYFRMRECNLISEIPDSFANLSSLKLLHLGGNDLEGDIPNGLFQLKILTELYLYNNMLSGKLPKLIDALNLMMVDLSGNNFTGAIPEEFGKLQKLVVLHLFDNQLSGSIPDTFANLSSLEELNLGSNNLVGGIPNGFIQLKNMNNLYLSRNQLTGALPSELGLHSQLQDFDVSHNKFVGEIPKTLCAQGSLIGLRVNLNNLSGEIPKSLAKCKSLQQLLLNVNQLTGVIPSGIWTLPYLSRLIIHDNKISGKLPPHLSPSLYFLDISNNFFTGRVPSSVANWKNLVIFRASNNQLYGAIPLQLTSLSNLNNLQLDGNQISGELPQRIISWKSLATLNFSSNKLFGPVPSVLGSLPSIRYMDLSNNKLSGHIPSELGQLILDKLNLSSNDLTGKIPSSLSNVAYLNSFLDNPNLCSSTPMLKIPRCSSPKHNYLAVILATGITTIVLVVLCLSLFIIKGNVCRQGKNDIEELSWELIAFHQLDFTESNVLPGLIEENVVASGGSGKVYCIEINDSGEKVVAKKIWNSKKLGQDLDKQFLAEVEILGKIRHANIVKLLCCISSKDTKLLVYEYMENGSLDNWLQRREIRTDEPSMATQHSLDWPTRLRIAIGAAKGLCYMHHDCSPPIIHRDVKSSNILLDSEFNAKVADFGLAKISSNKTGDPYTASAVAGSFGYIAPEYSRTRRLNEKIDIYSFGVVLLELSTGKEPRRGNDYMNLADWSKQQYHDGFPIQDALDDRIKEPRYLEEMMNVFKLGVICVSAIPSSRPSMKQVLELLISFNHGDTGDVSTHSGNDQEE